MSQAQRKRHLERIKTLTLQEAKGFGKKVNQLSSTVPTNSPGEAFTICGEHYSQWRNQPTPDARAQILTYFI